MKKSTKLTILLLSLVAAIMLSFGINFGMSDATYAEIDGTPSEESAALNVASVTSEGVVTNYETLTAAVEMAESDATGSGAIITLLADVSEFITFRKDKGIILDLGGKTLTAIDGKAAILNEGGFVTVRNGTILRTADTSYYVIKNHEGYLTLEDLTVSNDNAADGASLICNESDDLDSSRKATLTVKSGSYTAKNNQSNVIKNGAGDELIIEGGTFTMDGGVSGAHTVLTYGDITVTGGTIKASRSNAVTSGTVNAIYVGISDSSVSYVKNVIISNATIECKDKRGDGIYVGGSLTTSDVTVNITNCTISNANSAINFLAIKGTQTINISDTTTQDSSYGIKIASGATNSKIDVTLSNNTDTTASSASIYVKGVGRAKKEDVKIDITSGTYKKINGANPDYMTILISGGSFALLPAAQYVSTPIVFLQDDSGNYVVSSYSDAANAGYAASWGGVPYTTLQEAITESANNTKPIILLKDFAECVALAAGKTRTLDLNGFTLTDDADQNKPTITNEGTLTLSNGTVTNASGQPAIANAGTLTIKSGTYTVAEGQPAVLSNGTNLTVTGGEFNGGLSTESGTTTISGGKFNGELLLSGEGSSYSISRGTFCVLPEEDYLALNIGIKQDESGYYNALPLADAATDSVAKVGVYYYTTLGGAIADVKTGGTVTLLKNVTENVTVGEDKDFTLDLGGCMLTNDTESPTITNAGTLNVTNGTVIISSVEHAAILNKKLLTLTDGSFIASGNTSVMTESGMTTICGGNFNGGLSFGSVENVTCVVTGGAYTVFSLADLNLDKITFEYGYVAYIPVVSKFALGATDEINVTVSDIETAKLVKDEIEIVAGKDDENLKDMGFRINEDYEQVQTENGYEVVDLETYKEMAVADVRVYADEVGVILEESYTDAIVAAATFADVDKAVTIAKKHADMTRKIAQAKQEACIYVMSYAMAKNVEYTSEIDSIINDVTITTLIGVESAKSAAIAKVDEIYEEAKTEKERLEQAKKDALAEIKQAAAATEATQIEAAQAAVNIPVATLAAIYGAEDIEKVEEFKLAALADIANIRAMRSQIEEMIVDGEKALNAFDVLKETLSRSEADGKKFDAALRTLEDKLDIIKQDISLYTSSELLNIKLEVNSAITNAVNELELAVGDSVYEMTKRIGFVQNKVNDIAKTFGIIIDEETSNLISDGLNEVKTTISQMDGNLLNDYNDIDSKLKAANIAISNANTKLGSLGETVINAVNEVLESEAFIVLAAQKSVAEVNAVLTDFGKNFQSDEEFGKISALKSALEKSVADVKAAAEELCKELGAAGVDVSGIETAVYAIDTDNLSLTAQGLESVKTEIESAVSGGATNLTEKLTTISESVGTLTGKLKEANSGLSTEIEELNDEIANLESESFDTIAVKFLELHSKLERIDKKVQTAVGVETEKIKASEIIKKALYNLLGVDAVTPEAAANELDDGGLTDAHREILYNLYGEKNSEIIELQYKEANTAVANATTVEEIKEASESFKRNVDTVKLISVAPAQNGDVKKDLSSYLVYIMLGTVLILLFIILLVVLFKKGRPNYYYADTDVDADSEGWDDEYGDKDDSWDDSWDDEYNDEDGFEEDYKD